MDYLLKYGYIEKSIPEVLDFKMLTKNNICDCPEIIWSLFIEFGYLTCNENEIIKENKNEIIKEFNKKKFSDWKKKFIWKI